MEDKSAHNSLCGKLKVLISAYACNPTRGSEDGVGWGWVTAVAKYHEIWVVTADFHRKDIELEISRNPEKFSNIHFHYVPSKAWHYSANSRFWLYIENSAFKILMNYAYRLWQKDAFYLSKQLHKERQFDLAHQLTYVGFRFPGHLWKLDIPFVWGPIGGLENMPWRFLPIMGAYGCVYYLFRNLINSCHKIFLTAPKKAFKKGSGCIISATEGIRREIKRWYCEESEVICEVGPPADIAENFSIRRPGETLKLSWSGQHLPAKALPILLKALALLPSDVKWKLDILGEGPNSNKWIKLAQRLGVADRCDWRGRISRKEAISVVSKSHVFVITSFKDLTSSALIEALSQGVPVICPDHCGFSDVINSDCGIKIPVDNPTQIVYDMAAAVARLFRDESERQRLSIGALKRAREFAWDRKAEKLNEIYNRALSMKAVVNRC